MSKISMEASVRWQLIATAATAAAAGEREREWEKRSNSAGRCRGVPVMPTHRGRDFRRFCFTFVSVGIYSCRINLKWITLFRTLHAPLFFNGK
jgi:hypothetical protein